MLQPALLTACLAAVLPLGAFAQTDPVCDWQPLATIPSVSMSSARVGQVLWILQSGESGTYLSAFDLSDPAAPAMISSTPVADLGQPRTTSLGSAGHLIFLSGDTSVRIVDASDPLDPVARGRIDQRVDFWNIGGRRWDATESRFALITLAGHATVFDITDPDAPRECWASRPFSTRGTPVAIKDRVAYFLRGGELLAVDTRTTPANVLALTVDITQNPLTINAIGDRLLVGLDPTLAAFEYDIAHPAFPIFLGQVGAPLFVRSPQTAWDAGPRGILASGQSSIQLLDPESFAPTAGAGRSTTYGAALQFEHAFTAHAGTQVVVLGPDIDFAPAVHGTVEHSCGRYPVRRAQPLRIALNLESPSECTYLWRSPDGTVSTDPEFHLERWRLSVGFASMSVTVTNACGPTRFNIFLVDCTADFNADDFVDVFDYIDFVDAFESGHPYADINTDGFLDFFDYSRFIGYFESGCIR